MHPIASRPLTSLTASTAAVLVLAGLLASSAQAAIIHGDTALLLKPNQTLRLGDPLTGPVLVSAAASKPAYMYFYNAAMGFSTKMEIGTEYTASFNFPSRQLGKFSAKAMSLGDLVNQTTDFSPNDLASYTAGVNALPQEMHVADGLYGFKFRSAAVTGTPWMYGWLSLGIMFDPDDRGYHVAINSFAYDDSGAAMAVGFKPDASTGGQPAEELPPAQAPAPQPTAVPEPGGLALLGLALGVLGWTRRHGVRHGQAGAGA